MVKKWIIILLLTFSLTSIENSAKAQCSVCTKTAQQMGEKPAIGLNNGILYLVGIPFVIMGYLGYRWWQDEKLRDKA